MDLLKEIIELPEGCRGDTLQTYFEAVLTNTEPLDRPSLIEALGELAGRQWHTYTKLDLQMTLKIEAWLEANWDRESLHECGLVCSIVATLGLKQFYDLMRSETHSFSKEIRDEMRSFFDEMGESVEDPYSGMRRDKRI